MSHELEVFSDMNPSTLFLIKLMRDGCQFIRFYVITAFLKRKRYQCFLGLQTFQSVFAG